MMQLSLLLLVYTGLLETSHGHQLSPHHTRLASRGTNIALQEHGSFPSSSLLQEEEDPSVFAVVFTKRTSEARRAVVRGMWTKAATSLGKIEFKFGVCNEDPDEHNSTVADALAEENSASGDLLLLNCKEGYHGLTLKLARALEAYHQDYSQYKVFMKTDDDSFVAWSRLYNELRDRSHPNLYMGVPTPAGHVVNRDRSSRWFQSYTGYRNDTWPMSMEGGPGYIIGGNIANFIVTNGIVRSNDRIANEDQAAGVWVFLAQEQGLPVQYVGIAGTDGYRPEYDVCSGAWADYPFLLHHNLDEKAIECLSDVDQEASDEVLIDPCFPNCHPASTDPELMLMLKGPRASMDQAPAIPRRSERRSWAATDPGPVPSWVGRWPTGGVDDETLIPRVAIDAFELTAI